MSEAKRDKSVSELFGQPDPPSTGRGRLLATAIELFYTHGFNAIGIDRIIAEAGVTKTTFYKHFESKDELLVEAVRMRDRWEREAWERAAQELVGDDPRARLLAYFNVLDIWFNDPDFRGCIFINAAAEFPNPNDPVHEVAAEHKRSFRDHIRDLARRAKLRDAENFADLYVMLFEGALIMRHVHGRDDAARAAKPAVEQLITAQTLEQHEPAQ